MSLEPAAVIREHAGFVWRVLRHFGLRESQLDDGSQEVFLVVLRQLDTFQGHSSLRTWIFGICRNVAQRMRTRQLREAPGAALPEQVAAATQDREVWLKQAHAQLIATLDTLDPEQRDVFVLYEIEELPMEEIAVALQAPLTTCYSRLASARSKIESALRRKEQRGAFQLHKGRAR